MQLKVIINLTKVAEITFEPTLRNKIPHEYKKLLGTHSVREAVVDFEFVVWNARNLCRSQEEKQLKALGK